MTWENAIRGGTDGPKHEQAIELFGTHLRLVGRVELGRFGRLTDLINASSGYLRVHEARLFRPDGEATGAVFDEIMVDQDEISFIAQGDEASHEKLVATGFVEDITTPGIEVRKARGFVVFTPAHTLSGHVYLFGQTHIDGFVDATDPRFVALTEVTVRSLAEDKVTAEYPFVLINRTQMIAAAELPDSGTAATTGRAAKADSMEPPQWPEADIRPGPLARAKGGTSVE
jgi:hypothetical protein